MYKEVSVKFYARLADVFREIASGAKTDRAQLRRALAKLQEGDVLVGKRAFVLGDAWADTTTPYGRLGVGLPSTLAQRAKPRGL